MYKPQKPRKWDTQTVHSNNKYVKSGRIANIRDAKGKKYHNTWELHRWKVRRRKNKMKFTGQSIASIFSKIYLAKYI